MIDKLKKFYLKLPMKILQIGLNGDFNRETRRKLKTYKKNESKINYILKEATLHSLFIEYMYYNNNNVNYMEGDVKNSIKAINSSNFIETVIYLLKNFYTSIELKEYILSDSFDEDIKKFMTPEAYMESECCIMNNYEDTYTKLIIKIKEENGFHNIYPLFEIKNENLIKVKEEQYPDYGNINVYPYSDFAKEKYDSKSPLWILKFNINDLEETTNKTKYKIDGSKLVRSKSIYSINDEEIYEIVEVFSTNSNFEKMIYSGKVQIKGQPYLEKVFVCENDYIYGPFTYSENRQGGGYFLNKDNGYIIEKYSISENRNNLSILNDVEINRSFNSDLVSMVYFNKKLECKNKKIDIINDEELIQELKKVINIKNSDFSRNEIDKIRKNILAITDNYLTESRRERIINLIKNTEITDDFIESDLVEIIRVLIEGEDTKNKIAQIILQNPEILRSLQNVQVVQKKIELMNVELRKSREELNEIQQSINEANEKSKDKLIKENQSDLNELLIKKNQMVKNIEELTQQYDLCNEIDSLIKKASTLRQEAKEAEDEYNVFSRKKDNMKKQARDIENEIKRKLENATNLSNYSDLAFDGMLANEMLESAANWNKKKEAENFDNLVCSKEKVKKKHKIKSFNNDELIEYIYEKLREQRNYKRNDVLNMMICFSQGFLTVFAGEPGVGKTSICNIMAKILGVFNKNEEFNRYVEVSVEKGWTSKRDLVGYYNPLNKSFDKNNKALFNAFNILNKEKQQNINDFPYFILLDEANLSSMEHYWADFMNVCDLNKENRVINLGEDYIFEIPETLRFLATINYDHTTETLSPRLLDRAWIILLDEGTINIEDYNSEYSDIYDYIILYQDIMKCFSTTKLEENDKSYEDIISELEEIYRIFRENSIAISPRVDITIKKYLQVGCKIFEKTDSTAQEFVALDYAVAQKLLPKIGGFGEKYKSFLEQLEENFDRKNMMKCRNIINHIIRKGDNNMQYYQFFS